MQKDILKQPHSYIKDFFHKLIEITHLNETLLKDFRNSNVSIDNVSKTVFEKILKNKTNSKGPTHAFWGSYKQDTNIIGTIFAHKNSKTNIEPQKINIKNKNHIKLLVNNKILWSNFTNKNETLSEYQNNFDSNIREKIKQPIKNFISYQFDVPDKNCILCAFNYPKNISQYDAEIFKGFAISLQFFELFNYQFKELEKTHLDIITRIQMLTEKREPQITGKHIQRVKSYAKLLAESLRNTVKYNKKIDEKFINDIYNASSLHDIGKVGIPDAILNKEDLLTKDEFEIIKKHTIIGGEVLKDSQYLALARDIALFHQEKYDGTGYPRGLRGEQIPLAARIVSLADVFDALSTQRSYKKSISFEKVKTIIIKESGHHFDPDIVKAFLNSEKDFLRISKIHSS